MDIHDAISEIRVIADRAGVAVSIVTPDDVLSISGIDNPTDEQRERVRQLWEWRHYGDNWSDWFDGVSGLGG